MQLEGGEVVAEVWVGGVEGDGFFEVEEGCFLVSEGEGDAGGIGVEVGVFRVLLDGLVEDD